MALAEDRKQMKKRSQGLGGNSNYTCSHRLCNLACMVFLYPKQILILWSLYFFSNRTIRVPNNELVNYKSVLTKSIVNDWTSEAFAICHYGDWTPCCYSCWTSATTEGVQSGVRHYSLQGNWWDRSLNSWMILGIDLMISILASPHT